MSADIWSGFFGEGDTSLAQRILDDDGLDTMEIVEVELADVAVEVKKPKKRSRNNSRIFWQQTSRNKDQEKAGKANHKQLQDAINSLHQTPHPLSGQTVRLSKSLPTFNGLLKSLFDGLPTLANQEFEVKDWFDHEFNRTIWSTEEEEEEVNEPDFDDDYLDGRRQGRHRKRKNPCRNLGEYSIPAMVFRVRLAELRSRKGSSAQWLNNDIVVGHIDGKPIIVMDSEIERE